MRRTITIGRPTPAQIHAPPAPPRKTSRAQPIVAVEPGDVVSFTAATGEAVKGRAWPFYGPPARLHVEAEGGKFYELPPFEELTVRRPRATQKRLPLAEYFNDFRPRLDLVVRFFGRHFAVSADGTYAAVEVLEYPVSVFTDGLALSLLKAPEAANRMFQAVQRSPFLSAEGRRERLDALLATGKVTFVFEVRA